MGCCFPYEEKRGDLFLSVKSSGFCFLLLDLRTFQDGRERSKLIRAASSPGRVEENKIHSTRNRYEVISIIADRDRRHHLRL